MSLAVDLDYGERVGDEGHADARESRGSLPPPGTSDAQDAVERMQADVFGRVGPLLTGLALAEFEAFGGVEIREHGSDLVLWRWHQARR